MLIKFFDILISDLKRVLLTPFSLLKIVSSKALQVRVEKF